MSISHTRILALVRAFDALRAMHEQHHEALRLALDEYRRNHDAPGASAKFYQTLDALCVPIITPQYLEDCMLVASERKEYELLSSRLRSEAGRRRRKRQAHRDAAYEVQERLGIAATAPPNPEEVFTPEELTRRMARNYALAKEASQGYDREADLVRDEALREPGIPDTSNYKKSGLV